MSECKRCDTELVKDKDRGCLYCPLCHPPQKKSVPTEELEKNYIDVKPSEMRRTEIIKIIKEVVPDLIRDELENWIKPVTTKAEPIIVDNPNWKSEAKELNIALTKTTGGARKKADVILDVEKKKASL